MKSLFLIVLFILGSVNVYADELSDKLEKILFPCVRVLNGHGGGSGTVIYSEDREKKGEFQTFVLTNHHVIADLVHITRKWDNLTQSWTNVEDNDLATVEMFSYANEGRVVTKSAVKAEVIAYVEEEDMALLKLIHPFQIKFVTEILPADKHLRLFQEIYTVGCPLLLDPLFNRGEVTSLTAILEKKSYTSGSANIIWGNSGGAVLAKFGDVYYFVGIPSRMNMASNGQAATFLGYYVTPERIRNFFTTQKLDFLLDKTVTPTKSFEIRKTLQKNKDQGPPSPSSKDETHQEPEQRGTVTTED